MIKNLVLGSEGFVGKPFCQFLQSQGEEVIRFDLKQSANQDARSAILDLHSIDRIYFLAWEVGGAKYLYREDSQLHQLDWNLRLLLNVMPQLDRSGLPFLFVSSQLAEEYDTVYGVIKRLGEVWTHLLKGVRIRLWNVYGAIEEPSERSHVIVDFVHQALTTNEIRMLTNGEEQRQFIYIDDVCSAFHLGLSARLQGVYDVTSFEWVRILDVARIIAEYTGAKVIIGGRTGNTPITPIRGRLPGWMPCVPLEEGLKRLIDAMKGQLASKPPIDK